jgi:hypothetical protein
MDTRLLIFASNVATILDRNPFQFQSKGILSFWQRHPSYPAAEARYQDKQKTEIATKVEKVIKEVEKVKSIIQDGLTQLPQETVKESSGVLTIEDLIRKPKIDENVLGDLDLGKIIISKPVLDEKTGSVVVEETNPIPHEFLESFLQEINSHFNKTLGSFRESKVQEEFLITPGNDKFYKRYFDDVWGLGGRIDGWDKDGNIIEIKNRRKEIHYYPPDYDLIQLATYLWVMEKDLGYLYEQLMTTGETKITPVALYPKRPLPDNTLVLDEIWDACLKELVELAPRLQKFVTDIDKQDRFLSLVKEAKFSEATDFFLST